MDLSSQGRLLALSSPGTSAIRVWRLPTVENMASFVIPAPFQCLNAVPPDSYPAVIGFSPDEQYLAIGGSPAFLRLVNLSPMMLPRDTTPSSRSSSGGVGGGGTLASTTSNGMITDLISSPQKSIAMDRPNGNAQPIEDPLLLMKCVTALTFCPKGEYLALGGFDGQIAVMHIPTRRCVFHGTESHTHHVTSLAWSSSGEYFASGALDHTVILWSWTLEGILPPPPSTAPLDLSLTSKFTAKGECLYGHLDPVQSVQFSPDSRWLFSGSLTTPLLIWDVATRSLLGSASVISPSPLTLGPSSIDVPPAVPLNPANLAPVPTAQAADPSLLGSMISTAHLISLAAPRKQGPVTIATAGPDGHARVWSLTISSGER